MIILCFTIFLHGVSALKADNYNFFLDQIQRNTDHKVDPCDNFYRHACPVAVKEEDTIVNYVHKKLYRIIHIQKEKSPLPDTIIEKLYTILNPTITEPKNRLLQFLVGLRNTSYIVDYFRENKIHLREEHAKLHKITEDMLRITKDNMQMSANELGKNQTQEMILSVDEHQLYFGLESEVNAYKRFKNILIELDKMFEGHFKAQNKNPITESDVVLRKQEFYDILQKVFAPVHEIFSNFNMYRTLAIANVTDWNAMNNRMITSVNFFEGILIPLQNTAQPTKYGYFGSVFGHELMHTYFLYETRLEEGGLCVTQHAHKVCETFASEGLCHSGNLTYEEDAADYEGLKLAFKAFLEEFGNGSQDVIIEDMNVTNQQLFFYSYAKGLCAIHNDHRRNPNGEYNTHSPSFVRVNGALSLMKGFHEAFKCKAGDRMRIVADGHCTRFGNPVKRL